MATAGKPDMHNRSGSLLSRNMLAYACATLAFIAALFVEATQPPTIGNGVIPHLDKGVHFAAFGFLAFLLIKLIRPATIRLTDLFLVCLIVLGVSAAAEWIQTYHSARDANLADIGAGLLGAFSMTLLVKIRCDRGR